RGESGEDRRGVRGLPIGPLFVMPSFLGEEMGEFFPRVSLSLGLLGERGPLLVMELVVLSFRGEGLLGEPEAKSLKSKDSSPISPFNSSNSALGSEEDNAEVFESEEVDFSLSLSELSSGSQINVSPIIES